MEVSVEGDSNCAMVPTPKDVGIVGRRHLQVGNVQGINARFPQQRRRPPWHALVKQDPHETAFVSTISSPITAGHSSFRARS